ncbi:RES family NAD+ phosphorylase [uncultured Pelagimonas sp.]|uniref:RES family NAD+ phosphorylase n=1 Tax=uncultured Pelagimonas sp. TaxID=1618102 RepID=UPI00260793EC|nr:RES family NAD+ phosphorylase [uncultured Pelagimonas sp.]
MKKLVHTDILRRTRQLGRIDLSKASFRTLQKEIRKLSDGTAIPIQMSPSTEFFFRVRKNPGSKIADVEQLMAPPAALVTGFQRCNGPAEPIFYAASDRLTALKETRVDIGDTVYLSQWIAKQKMPFNHVFAPNGPDGYFEQLTPAETALYTFFDAHITKQIGADFADDYKLTAAIAKFLMSNFTPGSEYDIRDDRSVGLRYSSVLSRETSFNVAFKPNFAVERLELCHVLEGRIVAVGEGGEPKLEVLDSADDFSDGKVAWSGDPHMIPLKVEDKKRIQFIRKNGRWTLPVHQRPVTAEDIEEFVCEDFQASLQGNNW